MKAEAEVIRGTNATVVMRLVQGYSGVDHLAGDVMARGVGIDLGDSGPAEARKLIERAIRGAILGHSPPRIDVYAFEPYDAKLLVALAKRGETSETSADALRKEYGAIVAKGLAEKAGKLYAITPLGREIASILA